MSFSLSSCVAAYDNVGRYDTEIVYNRSTIMMYGVPYYYNGILEYYYYNGWYYYPYVYGGHSYFHTVKRPYHHGYVYKPTHKPTVGVNRPHSNNWYHQNNSGHNHRTDVPTPYRPNHNGNGGGVNRPNPTYRPQGHTPSPSMRGGSQPSQQHRPSGSGGLNRSHR